MSGFRPANDPTPNEHPHFLLGQVKLIHELLAVGHRSTRVQRAAKKRNRHLKKMFRKGFPGCASLVGSGERDRTTDAIWQFSSQILSRIIVITRQNMTVT